MTRRFVARQFTAQEQREQRVSELVSILLSGESPNNPAEVFKELLAVCERGQPHSVTVTFQPLRLEDLKLTLITIGSGGREAHALKHYKDSNLPWDDLLLPPNFSYRLLQVVNHLLETERQLAIAQHVPQTAEAVEDLRDRHVTFQKAYINERLGISRGRPGEYDLSQLGSHYRALLPVLKLAKRIFNDNSDRDTWRAMVAG